MAPKDASAYPILPAGTVLRVVLWLALVAGLAEGSVRLVQRGLLGRLTLVSPHIIWLAPAADLVWIGVPGVLLLLLARVPGLRVVNRVVLPILFAVASLTLILLVTSMHKGIALLLALAVGVRLAGLAARHADGFRLLVRRSTPVLLGLAILGGLTIAGVRRIHEARALASRPDAAGKPNVLLIIWDTVREENLSLAGYGRPTSPRLEALARGGTWFELALAPAPWTLPSHATIFTAHRPRELSAHLHTPLDDTYPTLAEFLDHQGYATAGFVANMSYTTREHGLSRGFAHYEDHRLTPLAALGASRLGHVLFSRLLVRRLLHWYDLPDRKPARVVVDQFLRWSRAGTRQPFFAFLNFFDAHQPYLPPPPYWNSFSSEPDRGYHPRTVETRFSAMTAGEIRWSMDRYDEAIAYLDAELGRLLDSLARRQVLDRTIVIVTSDHGEQFGEHQQISHGNTLYRQLLQVPLVIRYPRGVPAGLRVREPVGLQDLARTIYDLADLPDSAGPFPGRSLGRFWRRASGPDGSAAATVLSEMSTRAAVAMSLVDSGFHFISWYGHSPELYALSDPDEVRNLVGDSSQVLRVRSFEALRDSLSAMLDPPKRGEAGK